MESCSDRIVSEISIFACESQPIVLAGLEKLLGLYPSLRLVGAAANVTAALPLAGELRPAVVLVDQSSGLKNHLQFIQEIRAVSPASHVVLWITDLADTECFRALQLGARGIARKTLPLKTLAECILAVAGGDIWIERSLQDNGRGAVGQKPLPRLTPREQAIARLVCKGMKNKEIAGVLEITAGTVKVHLMHIFEKVGVKDRFELAMQGRKLLSPESAAFTPLEQDTREGIGQDA
jgi:two-component system, NarL family, nitrate/nitrite response regulator NarL